MKEYIFLISMILSFSSCLFSQPFEMVEIIGGKYTRGEIDGKNNPLQGISVDGFLLSRHEVTINDFRKYLREVDPSSDLLKDKQLLYLLNKPKNFIIPDDWPVYQVTFYQALEYCNWLSRKYKYDPVYRIVTKDGKLPIVEWDRSKNGFRLPTEAEWEFAAIGGKKGNASIQEIEETAWIGNNSNGTIHPVGRKKPNGYGIYDIIGNVAEWCWDLYDVEYYKYCVLSNPAGPKKGNNPVPSYESDGPSENDRVVRGFTINSSIANTYARDGLDPELTMLVLVGFRVARNTQRK